LQDNLGLTIAGVDVICGHVSWGPKEPNHLNLLQPCAAECAVLHATRILPSVENPVSVSQWQTSPEGEPVDAKSRHHVCGALGMERPTVLTEGAAECGTPTANIDSSAGLQECRSLRRRKVHGLMHCKNDELSNQRR
jgi:hypothetical protein